MTIDERDKLYNKARRMADYDRLLHIISKGQEERGGVWANYRFERKDDNNDGTIMIPWIFV